MLGVKNLGLDNLDVKMIHYKCRHPGGFLPGKDATGNYRRDSLSHRQKGKRLYGKESRMTTEPNPPTNPPNPPPNPPAPPADPPKNDGPSLEGIGQLFGGFAQQLAALPEKFADVLDERAPKPPEPTPPAGPPADPPKNPQGVKTAEDKGKKSWAERHWFG